MKRHIVLIGLPGAGKSVVGAAVARLLGAHCVDGDDAVARKAGKPVSRVFADDGEAAFRRFEREAVTEALAGPACVIAPGGGWAVQPGALEGAGAALVVYLEVSPAEALSRIDPAGRPLLAHDPEAAMARLAAERFPLYRRAGEAVNTDGRAVHDVAEIVVRLARSKGGW